MFGGNRASKIIIYGRKCEKMGDFNKLSLYRE